MTISRDENIVLHNILFEDYNYEKWAPSFPEFVRENSKGILAGILKPRHSVTINDIFVVRFMNFLKAKGIYI